MLKPVAWMYERGDERKAYIEKSMAALACNYTETPLYALPKPADDLVGKVEAALKEYLGKQCGMVLKPHALSGLARAAILALKENQS